METIEKLWDDYSILNDEAGFFAEKHINDSLMTKENFVNAFNDFFKKSENWNLINDDVEPGIEVLGFSKSWIDEDNNPDGICLCVFYDEGYWMVTKWCGYHDEWHTRYSHEAKTVLGDNFGGHEYIDAPTHWKRKPSSPITNKEE